MGTSLPGSGMLFLFFSLSPSGPPVSAARWGFRDVFANLRNFRQFFKGTELD